MISKIKLVFFAVTSNMLLMNLICFTTLIDLYKQSSWIYLLFYMFVATVISLLFNGFKSKQNVLKLIKKNHILRILITIYLLIIISLITIFISITMKKYFYFKANIIILFSVLLITSIIISNATIKNIIDSGSLVILITFILYIIPLTHIIERDYLLLLPMEFDITKVLKAIIILMFPLDNFIFSIQSDFIKGGFTRKTLVIINILTGIYLLLMIIDTITLIGANFYVDLRYSGLFRWQLFQGNKFIENFSIFLLVMMVVTSVYRLAFYFETLKKVCFLKKTKITHIFLFIVFFLISYSYYKYITLIKDISNYLIIISLIILTIFFTIMTIYSYKGWSKYGKT